MDRREALPPPGLQSAGAVDHGLDAPQQRSPALRVHERVEVGAHRFDGREPPSQSSRVPHRRADFMPVRNHSRQHARSDEAVGAEKKDAHPPLSHSLSLEFSGSW